MSTTIQKVMTVSEVAEHLQVSEATVSLWIERKELIAMDASGGNGKNRHWRVEPSDLEAFKRRRKGIETAASVPSELRGKTAKNQIV
jgi:excisionase family DNA binding protein